jgi:hypothetical protein
LALNLALEQMNGWTWGKCCETARKVAVRMGVSITKNADTVKRWYRSFRLKRRFAVPIKQKHNLPPFLELNPDVCSALKTYACANLNTLSIEMMVEYLHNTVIPEMVKKEMNERNCNNLPGLDESICKQIILQRYRLTKLCPGAVYRWLRLLGFNYEAQRKGYYVDGHEKPYTVTYRKDFVKKYLMEEVQMFRWIQLEQEEAERLEKMGENPKNTGYHYKHPVTGTSMVEFHVDTCDFFQRKMNEENAFGGRPSVRRDKSKKMMIKIGHDEAIMKQYLLTKKNGEVQMEKLHWFLKTKGRE